MLFRQLLATAAMAALAANTDQGSKPEAVLKSDAAPQPLAPVATVLSGPAAVQPQPDPAPAPVGAAPDADLDAPTSVPKGRRVAIVWAEPGHQTLSIGALYSVPPSVAYNLRAAGRARYASEAEQEAGKDSIVELAAV